MSKEQEINFELLEALDELITHWEEASIRHEQDFGSVYSSSSSTYKLCAKQLTDLIWEYV